MKYISHRGNINGKSVLENSPQHILDTLEKGYDVEVDIWFYNGGLFLGHDVPKYEFIRHQFKRYLNKLWFHCKNVESINEVSKFANNYFYHQNDDVTLTSNNLLWTFPNKQLTANSIAVLPEIAEYSIDELRNAYGICSDFILKYERELK